MPELIIRDKADMLPKGLVTIEMKDLLTGKLLKEFRLPVAQPNQATLKAKLCAARVLGGDMNYSVAQVEWGAGNTSAQASDVNLSEPFAPSGQEADTGVFTAINDLQFPSDGQILFLSALTTEADAYADGNNTVWIQEVGLRTNPLPGFPKGILVARFVNDAPIGKAGTRIALSVKWLYIYA